MYEKYIKRLLDFIFACMFVAVILPVSIIVAVLIKFESKGPILFKQKRVGKDAKFFTIYKFRTMYTNAPKLPPNKFKDVNKYITKSGAILRKTSLDELPQLLNVLRGDMSIIGPRPGAAQNENELIVERQKYGIFRVRPGITGWAQVNGRDELAANVTYKVAYDREYVSNICLKVDLNCLIMTFFTIIKCNGYKEGIVSNTIQQPQITIDPQTLFYAKVPSQKGKIQKRSVFRHKDRTKLEENS
jgi:O-antigen biosynthesis protein WbqP